MELLQEWLAKIGGLAGESRILGSLLIVAVSFLVAKLADLFTHRILLRLTQKSKFEWDDAIVETLHRPVYLTIALSGALGAVSWLQAGQQATYLLGGAIKTSMAVIWVLTLKRLLNTACDKWRASQRQGFEIIHLVENILRIVLFVGFGFLMLSFWKIDITPLLASAGIAGAAVALAAKDTLANFFGGVNVFLDRPFKLGDYIILESGERGQVVNIGVRSTRILTRDDVQISVPNSVIVNTKIVNESAPNSLFRVRVKVGVAFGSDIDQVENVLLSVANRLSLVSPTPAPRVRFRAFGDSSLDFELLCWAYAPADKGRVVHELHRGVYKAFMSEGLTIPFPQRDVYIHSFAGQSGLPEPEER